MKYTVYAIVNKNGLINEDVVIETDDIKIAKYEAKRVAKYDRLEPNPAEHSVEIRFNEDYEHGTYETVRFLKIYTANRETGSFIEEIDNIDDGLALIREYEAEDKKDGTYTPNFYDIVDEDHCSII